MRNRLQKSLAEKDKGFTLVELLVVVVIIGILAGIAIPLFLNQREKAAEAGVKSDLKNAATMMETYYVDAQTYTGDADDLPTFQETDANDIRIAWSNTEAFCLSGAIGTDAAKFFYNSLTGGLTETACGTAPAA